MKKIAAFLLTAAMLLCMAACSSSAKTGNTTTAAAAETTAAAAGTTAAAAETTAAAASGDTTAAASGKALKVAIIVAEYNEWNHAYYAEIEAKCKEFGWTSEIFDAKQDVNQEINFVNSAVAQGFNAITIQPADNAALAPSMAAAADAGLTVVSHYDMDKNLGINDKIYQVLFGQKASGVMEAEEYIKECGDSGKVAIIAGLTGADNAQQRTAGFMEVFDKHPNIKVVQTTYCDWDRQKAMAAAEDIITANPDLNAFIVQDDGMSWGVYEAIEAAGKSDQIKIASQGFYASSIEAIKDGKFLFSISYPASFFARDAMDMIQKVNNGEKVDRIQTLGMDLVTKDNCDTAAHD